MKQGGKWIFKFGFKKAVQNNFVFTGAGKSTKHSMSYALKTQSGRGQIDMLKPMTVGIGAAAAAPIFLNNTSFSRFSDEYRSSSWTPLSYTDSFKLMTMTTTFGILTSERLRNSLSGEDFSRTSFPMPDEQITWNTIFPEHRRQSDKYEFPISYSAGTKTEFPVHSQPKEHLHTPDQQVTEKEKRFLDTLIAYKQVKEMQVGKYKDICKAGDVGEGLEGDHIPSAAAIIKAIESSNNGKELNPQDR